MQKIISIVIICITACLCCYFVSNRIDASDHTISVQGDGEVHVVPDTLILSLRVEEKATTTEEAQSNADKKISKIKDIIQQYDIEASDIQSTNVNVYEDYDRTESGRVSRGYVASHSLEVKIKNVDVENDGVAGKIISEISKIGGVLVNDINYDVYDKSEYYSQARELAIAKAYQKASDLANYAGVKLGKPVSISESKSYDYAMSSMMKNSYMDAVVTEDADFGTDISLGEMDITLNVSVEYSIK